jgi:hypothetical protein
MAALKSLDWDLLKELECPVCLEYMTSSIKMCENGHNICDSCRSRISTCPTCKGEFIKGRNITLERIAAAAIYPCKNREAGCEQTFTVDEISSHESECFYQSRECPFRKLSDVDCPWTGALSIIGRHVRSDHGNETGEHSGAFEVTLNNFNTAQRYYKAIFTWGKLFYLVWETTYSTFYFSVFLVGQNNEAEDFLYDFKICKKRENISITGKCRSYLEAKSEVLKPGECVTLHYRTVEKHLRQNSELLCEIEIRKKSLMETSVVTKRRFVATPLENPAPPENAWYA